MTIIEGVGDEVIQFFVIVFIIVIGLLAWRSTNIAEQPFIRAVLVLEMMTRQRSETNQSNNTIDDNSIDTGQRTSSNSVEEESENSSVTDSKKETSELGSNIPNENVSSSDTSITENNQVQSEAEQNSSSVECTTLRREKGIAAVDDIQSPHSGEGKSVSENELPSEGSSCMENPQVNETSNAEDECNTPGIIRIRLKYLNDTQKLVEGNLEEQLGDFKRRHFGLEIQTNKLVRLIFNGHVLQSDSETLQNYGLFDNCVVHCLVHNQQVANSGTSSGNATEAGRGNGVDLREWDMDNHLFGSLSFILVAAWYCRYTYAQLFTTTTTVALVCLTGVFFVSLLGVYLPDQGRERQ